MVQVCSFPPIATAAARVLVLGSMPGAESLRQGRYYAHPQNAFWPIVGELLGFPGDADYASATKALRANDIALWDVLQRCERQGSLDSDIDPQSIVVNDFARFFAQHPAIRVVFCNGATAHSLYLRRVVPTLCGPAAQLPVVRLPSTSPAHASLRRTAKVTAWRVLLDALSARGIAASPCEGER